MDLQAVVVVNGHSAVLVGLEYPLGTCGLRHWLFFTFDKWYVWPGAGSSRPPDSMAFCLPCLVPFVKGFVSVLLLSHFHFHIFLAAFLFFRLFLITPFGKGFLLSIICLVIIPFGKGFLLLLIFVVTIALFVIIPFGKGCVLLLFNPLFFGLLLGTSPQAAAAAAAAGAGAACGAGWLLSFLLFLGRTQLLLARS